MSNHIIAGRYELMEKIGDGGMAVVYKARCRVLKRLVAIKILKAEYTKDAKFIDNFRKESHAAARLNNQNIVNIYDVGREENINYIVMEYVDGNTLSEIIEERGPLDVDEALDFARQIAKGLSAAHKEGIVHRDVKPHNILVTKDGIAKITDFGIAKAATDTTIIDKTNDAIMGSVHYFSPEQARGGYVDEKSDIYSLGIVLFEMLTGKVPFDADNPVAVALMQINDDIPMPSKFVRNIPQKIENIVLKSTEKYPSDRYSSAEDFIRAIDRVIKNSGGNMTEAFLSSSKNRATVGSKEDYLANMKEYGMDDYDDRPVKRERNHQNREYKRRPANSGKKKWIAIALATVLVIGALVAAAYMTGIIGGTDVRVPDFRGMSYEDAQAEAESKGLNVEIDNYVYSDEYELDQVASQDPKGGTTVKKGETIYLNLSKGPENAEVVVPKLIGKDQDDAEKIAKQFGFEIGSIKEKDSDEEKGIVIEQTPGYGEEGEKGSKIDIVISNGRGEAKVPNLLGESLSNAKKMLKDAGYDVGSINYGSSEDYEKGVVMEQQYKSGTKLKKGSTIDIKISRGATSYASLYVDFDEAEDDVFYLTVKVSDDDGTRTVISKSQRNKEDGGETIRVKGTGSGTIMVYFDNKKVIEKDVSFSKGDVD